MYCRLPILSSKISSLTYFAIKDLMKYSKPVTCRAEPDLEFEGLLKRQHTRVKYFQGSLMNAIDLERAKVSTIDQ